MSAPPPDPPSTASPPGRTQTDRQAGVRQPFSFAAGARRERSAHLAGLTRVARHAQAPLARPRPAALHLEAPSQSATNWHTWSASSSACASHYQLHPPGRGRSCPRRRGRCRCRTPRAARTAAASHLAADGRTRALCHTQDQARDTPPPRSPSSVPPLTGPLTPPGQQQPTASEATLAPPAPTHGLRQQAHDVRHATHAARRVLRQLLAAPAALLLDLLVRKKQARKARSVPTKEAAASARSHGGGVWWPHLHVRVRHYHAVHAPAHAVLHLALHMPDLQRQPASTATRRQVNWLASMDALARLHRSQSSCSHATAMPASRGSAGRQSSGPCLTPTGHMLPLRST